MSVPITQIETFNVQGIAVSAITLESARDAVLDALGKGEKGYVCVTNVHGISEAQNDPELSKIYNRAYLVTPDGMPLVWIGKWRAQNNINRVYGPDLMDEVCAATENTSYGHFIYGGAPGVAKELSRTLKERFPRLNIVGHYTPPFRKLNDQEESELVKIIEGAAPSIVWVGLSTPKQEKFMAEYLPKLNTVLLFGVGAAFDFYTGQIRQAPRWIQRSGFEWLFRLIQEPGRLWKRYLKYNPIFIIRFIAQTMRLKKYPIKR